MDAETTNVGPKQVYVSITGLRVKSIWYEPVFWWHAIAAMSQAKRAAGCLEASVRTIDGVRHTLTVWVDAVSMRKYVLSGAHRKAVRAFPSFATGKTFGFWADAAPSWDEVPALWEERGQSYGATSKS